MTVPLTPIVSGANTDAAIHVLRPISTRLPIAETSCSVGNLIPASGRLAANNERPAALVRLALEWMVWRR